MLVTYETSLKRCGATGLTLQRHQVLRLPWNISLTIDPGHKWDLTVQRHQILRLPRKMTFQKMTKTCWKRMMHHFLWRTIREWSDHDPNMNWSSRTCPFTGRGYFSRFGDACCIQNYNILHSGYLPKFHQIPCLPRRVTLQHHQYCACHEKRHATITKYCACPSTLSHSTVSYSDTVTWLNCYFTELFLYRTATLLNGNLLSCYCTELLLDWTATWLNCHFTELLRHWPITLPNWYLTELLLYRTVTLLNCYFAELYLYWAVTWLNCYFTELLFFLTLGFSFLNLCNLELSHLNFLCS